MRNFILQFHDDGLGEPKRVEFESEDAHEAFSILGKEAERRRVTLFEGERLIATITRTASDGWQVN